MISVRKLVSLIVVFVYLPASVLFLTPKTAYARALPLTANSAVMMDSTRGKILYSKRANKRRPPASTTKVLTALVVLDHLPLKKWIKVPKYAESIEPSKMYARAGEQYTVESLLKALLLGSANDAAYILAVGVAGSQSKFARLMNKKAKKLGAKSSYFVNPNGLPNKRQYSTSKDLALIMRAAQKNSTLVRIMKKKSATIYSKTGRKVILRNHNKLLWRDPRDIIGKTGWTRKARHCFVGRVTYGVKVYTFAIMGSVRPWKDLKILIDAFTGSIKQFKRRTFHEKNWSLAERKKIQRGLKKARLYKGEIDGKFGPMTQKAIMQFQSRHKLRADGMVGKKTYRTLKKYF